LRYSQSLSAIVIVITIRNCQALKIVRLNTKIASLNAMKLTAISADRLLGGGRQR
jgi:hypothetical protein